jgi:hypothetical protein
MYISAPVLRNGNGGDARTKREGTTNGWNLTSGMRLGVGVHDLYTDFHGDSGE